MKPPEVFDREQEWSDLERFLADPSPGLHLGIVSGRRRVGKSYLLRRLARTGIYHQAIEEDRAPALRRVAELVAIRRGLPSGTVAFDDWLPAFDALLGPYPGSDRPSVVVIDELPYLVARSPELLSVLQRAVDERVDGPPQALVLCGSALAVMTSLLSGSQPLRGRARLDLRMEPFDFRVARKFWGVPDAATAFAVHAIIGSGGGTSIWSVSACPVGHRNLRSSWRTPCSTPPRCTGRMSSCSARTRACRTGRCTSRS
ncbi:MAG: AAA family ATPase [Acidimicrobiales bacterium]